MKVYNFLFNKPLTKTKQDDYAKKIDNVLEDALKFIQTPDLFNELLKRLATEQKSFLSHSKIGVSGKSNIEKLLYYNERKAKNEKYKTKKTIFFNKLRVSLAKFKDKQNLPLWRRNGEFLNFCDYLDGRDTFKTKSGTQTITDYYKVFLEKNNFDSSASLEDSSDEDSSSSSTSGYLSAHSIVKPVGVREIDPKNRIEDLYRLLKNEKTYEGNVWQIQRNTDFNEHLDAILKVFNQYMNEQGIDYSIYRKNLKIQISDIQKLICIGRKRDTPFSSLSKNIFNFYKHVNQLIYKAGFSDEDLKELTLEFKDNLENVPNIEKKLKEVFSPEMFSEYKEKSELFDNYITFKPVEVSDRDSIAATLKDKQFKADEIFRLMHLYSDKSLINSFHNIYLQEKSLIEASSPLQQYDSPRLDQQDAEKCIKKNLEILKKVLLKNRLLFQPIDNFIEFCKIKIKNILNQQVQDVTFTAKLTELEIIKSFKEYNEKPEIYQEIQNRLLLTPSQTPIKSSSPTLGSGGTSSIYSPLNRGGSFYIEQDPQLLNDQIKHFLLFDTQLEHYLKPDQSRQINKADKEESEQGLLKKCGFDSSVIEDLTGIEKIDFSTELSSKQKSICFKAITYIEDKITYIEDKIKSDQVEDTSKLETDLSRFLVLKNKLNKYLNPASKALADKYILQLKEDIEKEILSQVNFLDDYDLNNAIKTIIDNSYSKNSHIIDIVKKIIENLLKLEGNEEISRDSLKKISALKNNLKKELSTFDTNIERVFKKSFIKKRVQVKRGSSQQVKDQLETDLKKLKKHYIARLRKHNKAIVSDKVFDNADKDQEIKDVKKAFTEHESLIHNLEDQLSKIENELEKTKHVTLRKSKTKQAKQQLHADKEGLAEQLNTLKQKDLVVDNFTKPDIKDYPKIDTPNQSPEILIYGEENVVIEGLEILDLTTDQIELSDSDQQILKDAIRFINKQINKLNIDNSSLTLTHDENVETKINSHIKKRIEKQKELDKNKDITKKLKSYNNQLKQWEKSVELKQSELEDLNNSLKKIKSECNSLNKDNKKLKEELLILDKDINENITLLNGLSNQFFVSNSRVSQLKKVYRLISEVLQQASAIRNGYELASQNLASVHSTTSDENKSWALVPYSPPFTKQLNDINSLIDHLNHRKVSIEQQLLNPPKDMLQLNFRRLNFPGIKELYQQIYTKENRYNTKKDKFVSNEKKLEELKKQGLKLYKEYQDEKEGLNTLKIEKPTLEDTLLEDRLPEDIASKSSTDIGNIIKDIDEKINKLDTSLERSKKVNFSLKQSESQYTEADLIKSIPMQLKQDIIKLDVYKEKPNQHGILKKSLEDKLMFKKYDHHKFGLEKLVTYFKHNMIGFEQLIQQDLEIKQIDLTDLFFKKDADLLTILKENYNDLYCAILHEVFDTHCISIKWLDVYAIHAEMKYNKDLATKKESEKEYVEAQKEIYIQLTINQLMEKSIKDIQESLDRFLKHEIKNQVVETLSDSESFTQDTRSVDSYDMSALTAQTMAHNPLKEINLIAFRSNWSNLLLHHSQEEILDYLVFLGKKFDWYKKECTQKYEFHVDDIETFRLECNAFIKKCIVRFPELKGKNPCKDLDEEFKKEFIKQQIKNYNKPVISSNEFRKIKKLKQILSHDSYKKIEDLQSVQKYLESQPPKSDKHVTSLNQCLLYILQSKSSQPIHNHNSIKLFHNEISKEQFDADIKEFETTLHKPTLLNRIQTLFKEELNTFKDEYFKQITKVIGSTKDPIDPIDLFTKVLTGLKETGTTQVTSFFIEIDTLYHKISQTKSAEVALNIIENLILNTFLEVDTSDKSEDIKEFIEKIKISLKSKNPVNIESLHLDLTSKSMNSDLDEETFPAIYSQVKETDGYNPNQRHLKNNEIEKRKVKLKQFITENCINTYESDLGGYEADKHTAEPSFLTSEYKEKITKYHEYISNPKNKRALTYIQSALTYIESYSEVAESLTISDLYEDFIVRFSSGENISLELFDLIINQIKTQSYSYEQVMIEGKQFKTQSYSYEQVMIEGKQYLIDATSSEGYSCGLHAIYGEPKMSGYELETHSTKREDLADKVTANPDHPKIRELALKVIGEYSDKLEIDSAIKGHVADHQIGYGSPVLQDFITDYNQRLDSLKTNLSEMEAEVKSCIDETLGSLEEDSEVKKDLESFISSQGNFQYNQEEIETFLQKYQRSNFSTDLIIKFQNLTEILNEIKDFQDKFTSDFIGIIFKAQVTQDNYPLTNNELAMLFLADQIGKTEEEQQSLCIYDESLGITEVHSLNDSENRQNPIYIHHKGAGFGFHYQHMTEVSACLGSTTPVHTPEASSGVKDPKDMSTKGLLEEEKDKLSILNAFKYELGLTHDEFKSLFIESISHFKDIIDLKSEDTLEKIATDIFNVGFTDFNYWSVKSGIYYKIKYKQGAQSQDPFFPDIKNEIALRLHIISLFTQKIITLAQEKIGNVYLTQEDSPYFLKSTDNHFYIIKKEQPGSDEIPIKIADDGTCLFRALLFLKRSRSLTHRPVSSPEECLFFTFNNKIQNSENVEQLEAYKIEINENQALTENHKRQLNDLCCNEISKIVMDEILTQVTGV